MWHDIKLVSDDSHFEGSPDQWRNSVDKEFRKYVPDIVKLPNGGDAWQMLGDPSTRMGLGLNLAMGHGGPTGWENLRTTGIAFEDAGLVGAGDGEQRLKEMDRDGIDAEVIYSPVGRGFASIPAEAGVAVAQGYNNWLSNEYCAVDNERLLGLGMLPSGGAADMADEIRRVKDLPGVRGVMLHQWPEKGSLPSPEDDVFWKAAAETGVPLFIHIRMGGGQEAEMAAKKAADKTEGPQVPIAAMLTKITYPTAYLVTQFILNGVFDRFPSLKISLAECGASWVPFYAESADTNYHRHRYWAGIDLPHEPSWYVRNHFLFGMQDDYAAVKMRDVIGVDTMTWGSDFPHVACDWPNTMALLDKMFDGVPTEDAKKILGGNLSEHLGMNLAA